MSGLRILFGNHRIYIINDMFLERIVRVLGEHSLQLKSIAFRNLVCAILYLVLGY